MRISGKHYGSTYTTSVQWPPILTVGFFFAPCSCKCDVFLANITDLLLELNKYNCSSYIDFITVDESSSLRVNCGDVSDVVAVCICDSHRSFRLSRTTEIFRVESAQRESASLRLAGTAAEDCDGDAESDGWLSAGSLESDSPRSDRKWKRSDDDADSGSDSQQSNPPTRRVLRSDTFAQRAIAAQADRLSRASLAEQNDVVALYPELFA